MGILGSLLNPQQYQQDMAQKRHDDIYRSLIKWEAGIGGEIFGQVPQGARREFFCLDERTWVWHEEWSDNNGHHVLTTRYITSPNGILKSQGNDEYQALSPEETQNFYSAIITYAQRVLPQLDYLRS